MFTKSIFKKNYLLNYFVVSFVIFIIFNFIRLSLVQVNIVFLIAIISALSLVAIDIFFFVKLQESIQTVHKKRYYYIIGITIITYLLSNLFFEILISQSFLTSNIAMLFTPLTFFYSIIKGYDNATYLLILLLDLAFIGYLLMFAPIKMYLNKFPAFDEKTNSFFKLTMILYVNKALKGKSVSFINVLDNIVPPLDSNSIDVLKVWETKSRVILEYENQKIELSNDEREKFKEFVKTIKYPIRIVHPTLLFED